MENKIFKYVIKNKHTGVIYYKVYSLEQIEENGLKGLFDIENYDIIARLQYTGLNDKNGRRIFEGDIIIFGDKKIKQVVEYRKGQYIARQINTKGSYIGLGYCDWEIYSEVIGNVHDKNEKL
jgi:uncharacterized phage protein (TIGR01671 family)